MLAAWRPAGVWFVRISAGASAYRAAMAAFVSIAAGNDIPRGVNVTRNQQRSGRAAWRIVASSTANKTRNGYKR